MIKAGVNNNIYEIDTKEGQYIINNVAVTADVIALHPGNWHWIVNNRSFQVDIIEERANKEYVLRVNGKVFTVTLKDKLDELLHDLGMDNLSTLKINDLKAPMPGLVFSINVEEGQSVKTGETLIVLEAMKMENALKAMADVTIKKIAVKKGQAVEKNEVLIFLE